MCASARATFRLERRAAPQRYHNLVPLCGLRGSARAFYPRHAGVASVAGGRALYRRVADGVWWHCPGPEGGAGRGGAGRGGGGAGGGGGGSSPMETFTFSTRDAYRGYQAILAAKSGAVTQPAPSPPSALMPALHHPRRQVRRGEATRPPPPARRCVRAPPSCGARPAPTACLAVLRRPPGPCVRV